MSKHKVGTHISLSFSLEDQSSRDKVAELTICFESLKFFCVRHKIHGSCEWKIDIIGQPSFNWCAR